MRTITSTSSAVPTQNGQVVGVEVNATAVVPITGNLQGRDVEEIITPGAQAIGARNIEAQAIGVRSIGAQDIRVSTNVNPVNTDLANTNPAICGRSTSIIALPVDVIAYILQFASLGSHASFMQACKAFEEMARKYSSIPVAIGRIQNVKSSDANQEAHTPWEVYGRLMAELQRVPQVMHAVFQTDLVCFRHFHVEAEQNPLHLQAAMRAFSQRCITDASIEPIESNYLQYKLCAAMLGISAYENNQNIDHQALNAYNNNLNNLGLSTQPTNSNKTLMRMCAEEYSADNFREMVRSWHEEQNQFILGCYEMAIKQGDLWVLPPAILAEDTTWLANMCREFPLLGVTLKWVIAQDSFTEEEPLTEIAAKFIQSQVVDTQALISFFIDDPDGFRLTDYEQSLSLKSDPTFILELLTATTKCTEEQTGKIFTAEWTTRCFNPVVMEQRAFYLAAAAIDSEYCRETFSFANAPASLKADPDFCLEMLLRDMRIFPEIPEEVSTPEFMKKLEDACPPWRSAIKSPDTLN